MLFLEWMEYSKFYPLISEDWGYHWKAGANPCLHSAVLITTSAAVITLAGAVPSHQAKCSPQLLQRSHFMYSPFVLDF